MGLLVILFSTGIACRLTISNEVVCKLVMEKYNEHKKYHERVQQSIISSDELD